MTYFFFLIGPAGSGKTTVSKKIANIFNYKIIECDNFHSFKNIKLMSQGIKLEYSDRLPWLKRINKKLKSHTKSNINYLISCSALKKSYRKILSKDLSNIFFIYLKCSKSVLLKRIKLRKHFFPTILLNDQIQKFQPSKDLITINANKKLNLVIKNVKKKIDTILKRNTL